MAINRPRAKSSPPLWNSSGPREPSSILSCRCLRPGRAVQPVILLAKGIGDALGLPVAECLSTTRPPTQLKGVIDRDKRKELLAGLYAVDAKHTEGKGILLFDDLFRSGATMNAITELLMGEGKAASVRALTITRTRSNQ